MDNMEMPKQPSMTGKVIGTIVASAVIFGGLGYYIGQMYETAPAGTVTYTSPSADTLIKTSPSTSVAVSPSASSMKSYSNTKYGYEFSYPDSATYSLKAFEGEGSYVTATATSDIISVNTTAGYILQVSANEQPGKTLSAGIVNGDYAYNKYETVKVGTASAYKVTVYTDAALTKASGDIAYYIQQSNGILKVKYLTSDSVAATIFASLKLTK